MSRTLPVLLTVLAVGCVHGAPGDDERPGLDHDAGDDDDASDPYLDDDDDGAIDYPNHGVAPGGTVRDGVVVDLTPDGRAFVESLALHLDTVTLPMSALTLPMGEFEGCEVTVGIAGLIVQVDFTHLSAEPIPHGLDVEVGVRISVNDADAPFDLELDLDGGFLGICGLADETCGVWVEPLDVTLGMTMWLDVIDPGGGGAAFLDATVATPTHNLRTALHADDIGLSGCLIALVDDILGFFGTDVVELVLDEAMPELYAFLEHDLPATLEAAIEDGFASATVDTSVDLLGVSLDIALEPRGLILEHDAIRLQFNGAFDAPLADCVAEFDPGGSPYRDIPLPAPDPGAHHHASAFVSQDLIDAALYTAWRGGLLCYELDPGELGVPLDTSVLGLLVDEQDRPRVERVWVDGSQPLLVATRPTEPPYLRYAGQHDLMVDVEGMGLDLVAFTQDRQARVIGMQLELDAAVDVDALGDGGFAIDVLIDTAALHPEVRYNELLPGMSAVIEQNFGELVGGMLDPLLDGLLGDLAIDPITFGGLGVESLEFVPAGPTGGYLGAYLRAGHLVPGQSFELGAISCDDGGGGGGGGCGGCEDGCDEGSCGEQGSCDEGSCDTGVSSRREAARAAWRGNTLLALICVGVWAARRRAG